MLVCLDIGGGSIKCAWLDRVIEMPNVIGRPKKDVRILVGTDLLDDSIPHGQMVYTRPCDRGYVNNFECEKMVLEKLFEIIGGVSDITDIVVTTPPFFPKELATALEELLVKYLGTPMFINSSPSALLALSVKGTRPFCVVVDSGFSFTHITPVFDGKVFEPGIRRIDVGGKILTNYLKELLSYGQINVLDETFVVNLMKEQVCYVSMDIQSSLEELTLLKNQAVLPRKERLSREDRIQLEQKYTKRYVLPDYHKVKHGYLLEADADEHLADQTVVLTGECFLVPELLFQPSMIGLRQAGVPEAIEQCVMACPEVCRSLLRRNIFLTGGNTKFGNFSSRVAKELGDSYSITSIADPIVGPCTLAKFVVG